LQVKEIYESRWPERTKEAIAAEMMKRNQQQSYAFDLKQELSSTRRLIKDICAVSNCSYGYIVPGISVSSG
jgi:predicted HTH transcriptional regulator